MWHVVSDFDGTITKADVLILILERLAGDAWREIETEYQAGRIGTREAVRRELEAIPASREEMLSVAEREAALDPDFPAFLAFARGRGIEVEVVSEGFEFYSAHLLRRWGLEVPLRTNRAVWEGGRVRVEYPYADPGCTLCGSCKMGRVLQLRAAGRRVAYVGDGRSDICPALEADAVFAKGDLARLCEREGVAYKPFRTFGDVQREMAAW